MNVTPLAPFLFAASLATAAATATAADSLAPAARIGAPEAATAGSPGLGSLTQVSLALLLVLALVFGLAWVLRRLRSTQRAGAPGIEVLAEATLGPKERAVLIQVDRARLLVGVAGGSVRTLHVLPDAEPVAPGTAAAPQPLPNFAELLRRSLGR